MLPAVPISEALVHRICIGKRTPAEPAFGKSAKYRFDDPKQGFGTLYCARDFGTCFLETLLRGKGSLGVARSDYDARSVVLLLLDAKQLTLVDMFSSAGLAKLGLDLAIVAGGNYTDTQHLGALVHAHPSNPYGILYRSRFDPEQPAIVLFDRASRYARIFPGSKAQPLSKAAELSDGVRNRVPFVFV
jgi:RES domain